MVAVCAVDASASAHWRTLYGVCLDCQPGCHVRDFQRSCVDPLVADKNIRHDIFAIPHRRGVGSEAGDDQIKTIFGSGKIDVGTVELVHSIVSPSSESSPAPNMPLGITVSPEVKTPPVARRVPTKFIPPLW